MPTNLVPLLRTKLHRPAPAPDALMRSRITKAMDFGQPGLVTLIVAPPGFGKSTAASQWMEQQSLPCGWLTLDARDNDLRSFHRYLVAAIQEAVPGGCPESFAACKAETLPEGSVLARLLINELLEIEKRFVLVLDDVHRVPDPEVCQLIGLFLEQPCPSMQLVMLARRDPHLPLSALRASGRLHELRMQTLRFTGEEGQEFLEKALGTELPEVIFGVVERAEGWPVALRLLLLRLRAEPDRQDWLAGVPSVAGEIRDYLIGEVLENLDSERLDDLLRCSILDRLCAGLCEAIVERDDFDGREFVGWLKKAELFLIPLDLEQNWFRFHHIFQDVLLRRLAWIHGADELEKLHPRASHWFEQQGLLEEAFAHGLKSPESGLAADLTVRHAMDPTLQGDYSIVESWLRRLPESVVESYPGLLVPLAWRAQRNGRRKEEMALIERLEQAVGEGEWDPSEVRYGQDNLVALRIEKAWRERDYLRLVDLAEEAGSLIPPDSRTLRDWVSMNHAHALVYLRREPEARALVAASLEELPRGGNATRLHSIEAHVDAATLNCLALRDSARRFYDHATRHGEASLAQIALLLEGFACYQSNDLEDAERILGDGEFEAELGQDVVFLRARALLMKTLFALGDAARAHTVGQAARSQLLNKGNAGLAAEIEIVRAELSLREGKVGEASRWAEQCDFSSPKLVFMNPNPYFAAVRVALAGATPEGHQRAGAILDGLFGKLADLHRPSDAIELHGLRALWNVVAGRDEKGLDDLARAVALAASGRAVRSLADLGIIVIPLLQRLDLDEDGLEFVARVMAAVGMHQPDNSTKRAPIVAPGLVESLTRREIEVLASLAQRFTNKNIAAQLGISVETVKRHAANIYRKLGVHGREAAVAKAIGLGILNQ